MGAANAVIFFGIRFELDREDTEPLELGTDERTGRAQRHGLQHYWGNFHDAERYLLFIGLPLSIIGPEHLEESVLELPEFLTIAETVKRRLAEAGFHDSPKLYMQWQPDL
jgi:hypothetical protein